MLMWGGFDGHDELGSGGAYTPGWLTVVTITETYGIDD
ncbi:MAG: hypothetical protein QOF51_3403, partial [Chloroflexota bacterium]|nr:hypothetical protein [Chloroflexota bacterium]